MHNTGTAKPVAITATLLLIAVMPAFAQTDAGRIAELEAKMTFLADQLAELRTEIDRAKADGQTGAARVETRR